MRPFFFEVIKTFCENNHMCVNSSIEAETFKHGGAVHIYNRCMYVLVYVLFYVYVNIDI